MTCKKRSLLLNAIPLSIVNTGINRYLKCLYEQLQVLYGDIFEIHYFDGLKISKVPPSGPANFNQWSRIVDLFWSLPPHFALLLRLPIHFRREHAFRKIARNFDIYHEAGFFPFAHPSELKTIFTIHDLSLLRHPEHHPKERVLYNNLFFHKRLSTADHILSVSEFTKREVVKHLVIPPEKITVTPLAHDARIFHRRTPNEISVTLQRFALPEKFYLFVGTGDPRKNLDVIPKALVVAKINIPLVMAGWSGWLKNKIRPENVISLGYISDEELACLYSAALAFVFPSIYEGFGLPVLEAMACGCPVVTTRLASLPEAGGDAAIYLDDPYNALELADILSGLASGRYDREQIVEKGLQHAGRFSWEKTAAQTAAVFTSLV